MFAGIDVTGEVKNILNNLFSVTAKKMNMAKKEVPILFQLKNIKRYKCSCNSVEVNTNDAGPKAILFQSKINNSITTGLLRLAKENNIELSQVNVLIKTADHNDFTLLLRNGNSLVKQIELSEFLNF